MIEMDAELIRAIIRKGKRFDNRTPEQYREVKIETNALPLAEGSCRVTIGDTEVIAGVKTGVGTPFGDTPDEGVLMVNAELLPLASSKFEPGPPREEAIELARVVDRAIRESKAIDFGKLCITPKEKVWMVNVDIDVINDDGNLIDACGLAAIAAIRTARLAKLDGEGNVVFGEKTEEKLPVSGIPISTTFVKIGDKILADPDSFEWTAMEARLTVGTVDKDGSVMLASMQKGGTSGLTLEEIDTIVGMALEKGEQLRNLVRSL